MEPGDICVHLQDVVKIERDTIISIIQNKKKPIVTTVMLSYKRPYMLIPALKRLLRDNILMNLCLRVQGAEELTKEERHKVLDLCERFPGYDVQFTRGNHYTGVPRHDVLYRALNHFDTPYIMTADDDMHYAENSVATCIALLHHNPEFGAISHWCDPGYAGHRVIGPEFKKVQLQKPFTEVDAAGSGTAIFRRKVYEKCEYDKNFILGCADFDFGMQLKKAGWKWGIVCIDGLKSLNNNKRSEPRNIEYWKHRYNKEVIKKSIILFKQKWGYSL